MLKSVDFILRVLENLGKILSQKMHTDFTKTFNSPSWAARRSKQSMLKEINPEYSLGEYLLKLNLQYFGHLMQRVNSWEKTLILGNLKAKGEGSSRG